MLRLEQCPLCERQLGPGKGDWNIEGNSLNERDGIGIWDTDKISIKALSQDAEVLLMEVPM